MRACTSAVTLFCLLLLIGPSGAAQQPITINGLGIDSDTLRASLGITYWRALAATPCGRADDSFVAVVDRHESISQDRARLARLIGVAPEPKGALLRSVPVFSGRRYTIDQTVIESRLPGTIAFAWVLRPVGLPRSTAAVMLLHGSGIHPQEAFAWRLAGSYRRGERSDSSTFVGIAAQFAEAGYVVYVPWLSDDVQTAFWPRLQWSVLERNGAALRSRVKTLGPDHLLINELTAGMDYLASLSDVDRQKIAVIGWSEGAQLAATLAAVDNRVSAVVRLAAPLDRVRLRSSIEGVLREAQFVHRDCELDDVAMARLLAPRPLLYSYSTEDPSVQRFAGYISSPVIASIRSLYSSVGARNAFGLMADTAWTADARRRLRTWVDGALQFIPRDVPAHVNIEQPPSQAAYRVGWMDSVRAHRQDYSVRLGTCLADRRKVNTSSIPSFLRSVEPLRREVAERLGVPVSASPGRTTVIQKTLIAKRNGYSLYFVQLRSTRTPILISGLLAIPQFLPSGGVPAVVSADGDAGLAAPFGLVPTQGQPYLNAYADRLAASGTVVFVAYYPFDFPEIAAAEVAARRVSNQSSFGYLIPVFSGVVDYLVSLPGVDKSRLGIWGISFGGAAALYAGAIDTRFSSVVFSDPVVTADVLYSDRTSASLATWWPEICSTVDAVQAYLIAPRRLVRENGLRDNNGYERTPLESITRIRDVYASLGIESNFSFVRHSGGHETRPSDVDLFPSQ